MSVNSISQLLSNQTHSSFFMMQLDSSDCGLGQIRVQVRVLSLTVLLTLEHHVFFEPHFLPHRGE